VRSACTFECVRACTDALGDLDNALRGESLLMGFLSHMFSSERGCKYLEKLVAPVLDKLAESTELIEVFLVFRANFRVH
jgi:hypothetical protein